MDTHTITLPADSKTVLIPTIPITILLTLSILTLIYYLLWKPKSSSSKKHPPPEAGGAWPIVGHLPLLGGSEPPHITLGNLADKHGPIFTVRMGAHRALVVSNREIAKECFTTNDKAFANRPGGAAVEHMAYNFAMFGFSPYGPYWRHVRKIATLELLSSRRLDSLAGVRGSEVKAAVKELAKSDRAVVEMKKWFGDVTLNTVLKMIVGERNSDQERYLGAIRDFFELTGTFVVGDLIPWLRWLDLGGYEKAMKKTAKELDRLLQGWLEEHKRKRLMVGETDRHEQDFMDVLLSILDDGVEELATYDTDTINKATCLAFILAGTDSTTVTMTWALSLLLNNPHTLKKAQQELDDHIGRERQVTESDTKSLPYLRAVLKETMRLYPALPLLAPHCTSQDCTVAGFHVAKGTRLLVNASKIQRDPRVWADPEGFDPERFLSGAHRNVDVRGQDYELMPFGSGRRVCPGIGFSFAVMELAMASLLHGFEIETTSDGPVDMRGTTGLAFLKASPLDVVLTPRLPSEAYC